MIPPHTIFLLQFARYHPEHARNAGAPTQRKKSPERRNAARRKLRARRIRNIVSIWPFIG